MTFMLLFWVEMDSELKNPWFHKWNKLIDCTHKSEEFVGHYRNSFPLHPIRIGASDYNIVSILQIRRNIKTYSWLQ
jgi:hypothetical protein